MYGRQIITDSQKIGDIILNFLALLFITQLSDEIMSARIINYMGAMGGKIVPVLHIEWQRRSGVAMSVRGKWMPLQKMFILTIVTVWHTLNGKPSSALMRPHMVSARSLMRPGAT